MQTIVLIALILCDIVALYGLYLQVRAICKAIWIVTYGVVWEFLLGIGLVSGAVYLLTTVKMASLWAIIATNAGALVVVVTLLGPILAVVMGYLQQTTPSVVVRLEQVWRTEPWIDLVIRNVGGGIAYDISHAPTRKQLSADRDTKGIEQVWRDALLRFGKRFDPSICHALSYSISCMMPGESKHFPVGPYATLLDPSRRKEDNTMCIAVSWQRSGVRRDRQAKRGIIDWLTRRRTWFGEYDVTLDLREFQGQALPTQPIAEAVAALRDVVQAVSQDAALPTAVASSKRCERILRAIRARLRR